VKNTFLDVKETDHGEVQQLRRSSVPNCFRLRLQVMAESEQADGELRRQQLENVMCQEEVEGGCCHVDTSSSEGSTQSSLDAPDMALTSAWGAVLGQRQAFCIEGQSLVVKNTFLHLGDDDTSGNDFSMGRRSSMPSCFRFAQTMAEEEQEEEEDEAESATSDVEEVEHSLDNRTTVMLRNLPEGFSHRALEELLDKEGFAASYDFMYLPADISTGKSFFYAFINLITPREAMRFHRQFSGFCGWPVPFSTPAAVEWSEVFQGFGEMTERYRNSPMMHPLVPEELRPVVYRDGVRVPFPAPTQPIPAPRLRRSKDGRSRRLLSSVLCAE